MASKSRLLHCGMRYAGGKLSQCSTAIHASLLCHADVAVVTGDGAWESWSLHLRRPIPEQKLGLCTSLLHCELRKRQALDNLPAHLTAAHLDGQRTKQKNEHTPIHTRTLYMLQDYYKMVGILRV